jgi:hypothetical protein
MAVARSEAGVEAAACSKAGVRQWRAMRLRMAGSGGMTMFRVTEEQERAWDQKIAKCGEKEHGA